MARLTYRPAIARRPRARITSLFVVLLVTAGLVGLGGVVGMTSASAVAVLTVTPTTTGLVAPNSTTTLAGLSITGDTTDTLQATVATDLGTLAITSHAGLTLAFANNWSGDPSITFTGSQADIDTALASAQLTTVASGVAHVSLTGSIAEAGFDYLAPNEHFYQYVADPQVSWFQADAAAKTMTFEGQQGYLATIPDDAVNDFISTKIANAQNVLFGARAYEPTATDGTAPLATVGGTTYARVWRWTEGADESPIAGTVISKCTNVSGTCDFADNAGLYSSWDGPEPNDVNGSATIAYQGEYIAVTNWNGTSGKWNDLSPNETLNISGYVVEYGGKPNSNPAFGTGFDGVITASSNVQVASAAQAPAAPTIGGHAGNRLIGLSWNPPADGGSPITGYQVSVSGGPWTTVPTTSVTAIVNGNVTTTISASLTGLTNGTTTGVQIRAINAVGPGTASNGLSLVPMTRPNPPSAPVASATSHGVTVSWTRPAANGSTITGYTVVASPGGATCTPSPATATACTVTGLTAGVSYTFAVVAHSTAGDSLASAASGAVQLDDPLGDTGANPLPPLAAGAIALVAGIALLLLARRRGQLMA